MKLVIAVVQGDDAERVVSALTEREFRVTEIASAGGFLRERNATLVMGVPDDDVAAVRAIIQQIGQPRTRFVNPLMPVIDPGVLEVADPVEVLVGGATVFVLPIERYVRLDGA